MAKLEGRDIRRLPIREFRARGYLHEVNRLVLHPLGLALEVTKVKEPGVVMTLKEEEFEGAKRGIVAGLEVLLDGTPGKLELQKLLGTLEQYARHVEAGDEWLGGVWDDQDDPEGIRYADDTLSAEKAERVCTELLERRDERKKHTGGWIVQPLPDRRVLSTTYTDPELRTTGREGDVGLHLPDGRFAGVELPEEVER